MIPHRDGWHLTPEGAAVHPVERTAVIADVHLGYEWARGVSGDCVPAHSLRETLTKLTNLLDRATIKRLVVAGDLVESPRPCPRTAADVRHLTRWLAERGVAFIALKGNHDPLQVPPLPETLEITGWTITHGHRTLTAPRSISGHYHPALRAEGFSFPCFLVGPKTIVLPAFSENAAGWNVFTGMPPAGWEREPLRCVAGAGGEMLDFGPLAELSSRAGTKRPNAQRESREVRR